jgi:hypothetical protein
MQCENLQVINEAIGQLTSVTIELRLAEISERSEESER